jgi:hypothetical protein
VKKKFPDRLQFTPDVPVRLAFEKLAKEWGLTKEDTFSLLVRERAGMPPFEREEIQAEVDRVLPPMKPPPPGPPDVPVRDPFAQDAPKSIRQLAERARGGYPIDEMERLLLRDWMTGKVNVVALPEETPKVPDSGQVAPEIVEEPTMPKDVVALVSEGETVAAIVNVAAPAEPVREWTDPDAPTWVLGVGTAMYEGEDVPDEPKSALKRWRRGEDVPEPKWWRDRVQGAA